MNNRLSLFLLIITISFCYIINIGIDNYIDYDIIISPLYQITSIPEYFNHKLNHKIYDLQPIRDLSHLLDILISPNEKNIHIVGRIHNLLLLFLTCFLLFRLFLLEGLKKNFSIIYALLFFTHPSIFEIYIIKIKHK